MMRRTMLLFLALAPNALLLPSPVRSQITDFQPTFGKTNTPVVITGPNFGGVTAVKFNGRSATQWSLVALTEIYAIVPVGATTGRISVTTPLGTFSAMTNFTVIGDEPYITGFSPPTGSPGTTTIIIAGANFTQASAVEFNGVLAPFFYAISDAQIQATVPFGVTTGPITVTSPSGIGSSITNFYVPPAITGFAPGFGKPGDSITVTGANFLGCVGVEFNGQEADPPEVVSNTSLIATVPAGALTGPITVITPVAAVDSPTNFLVAPRISGFSPATGAPGNVVTVTGANLSGATAFKFNGTNAAFSGVSASQISATVPQGATTGPLSVTTPAGTNTTSTNFFLAPKITGFAPSGGEAGRAVTITGVNFTGASEVKFSTAAATNEILSPTQISAEVPANAVTGPISVTAPAGTATTSSNFVVFTTADVGVSQKAAPDPVTVDSQLTYTITVTNGGPKAAADVLLTDTLPAGVQFVSAEPSQGSWSYIGGNVICSIGLLADAAAATVTLVVTPAVAGTITNQVTVTATTSDSDFLNNAASLTTTVQPPASPHLTVGQAFNNVVIAWPNSASNFVLQATGELRPPIVWTNVPNSPVVIGGSNTLNVDSRPGQQFFRLKWP